MSRKREDHWVDHFLEKNRDILDMACKMINSEEYMQLNKIYQVDPCCFRPCTNETHHRKITTEAANLVKYIMIGNGTEEEIKTALKYLYICMDCVKYRLNYLQFRKDYKINELIRKYRH